MMMGKTSSAMSAYYGAITILYPNCDDKGSVAPLVLVKRTTVDCQSKAGSRNGMVCGREGVDGSCQLNSVRQSRFV